MEGTNMLTLYLERNTPETDDILDQVSSMAVAHEVVYADERPETPDTPALREGDETVAGLVSIMEYLEEFREFLARWQKFQSDACYCDADGNVE
jgi:hypothetical protein